MYIRPQFVDFCFSSGASPAHNAGGRVLPLCIYQIFFTKELEKYNARRISTHYLSLSLLKLNIWGCPNVWVAKWVRFITPIFKSVRMRNVLQEQVQGNGNEESVMSI